MVDEADHGATSVDFNNPLWSSSPMVNTTNFRYHIYQPFFFPQREQHKFNNKSNLKYVAFDDFQEGLSNVSNCELEFLPAVASTPIRQNASVSIKDGEKNFKW